MRLPILRGLSRLPRLLAFAAALGLVGSLAAIPLGPVQKAAAVAETPGWYMIVSDYYDGTAGHGDGKMRCLSTNARTSTSGSGTHSIYMAVCNPNTPGQWWRLLSTDGWDQLRNWQRWDGATWCLSGNQTTPPGFFTNTHGAYTSKCSSATVGQYWNWYEVDSNNRFNIQHYLTYNSTQAQWLSTTDSLPYDGNLYQVFTAAAPYEQVWRLYAPTSPPSCSPCG